MWDFIRSLKDPILVARIQEYYGVRVLKFGVNSRPRPRPRPIAIVKMKGKHVKHESHEEKSHIPTKGFLKSSNSLSNGVNTSTRDTHFDYNNDADAWPISSESEIDSTNYVITNHWWYYLFILGTALGDEIFYASFIPFWFWNVDGAVGRRVVLVWATIMYIGQGIKDIVRWPRPACPPVVRLQKKWALEYGMPSTHAMVGISIPFSVVLYTVNRYQYSLPAGLAIAVAWCMVVCISRLYLGMHTVLDIVVGLLLAMGLMIPVVPLVDALDHHLLTNRWSPAVMLLIAILLVAFYPASDRWTPTRTDTTMVVSVCVGVHLGAWTNYQLGYLTMSMKEPPYEIIWPTYSMVGLTVFRTALGFCCIIATRALCKSASYATVCTLLRLDPHVLKQSRHSMENTCKATVEITYTFITYLLLGFNTAYLLPNTFRLLGIERPTFYTEI